MHITKDPFIASYVVHKIMVNSRGWIICELDNGPSTSMFTAT